MKLVRKPSQAGRFYPAEIKQLNEMLGCFIKTAESKKKALGVVSPHAGYVYSGKVAGLTLSSIQIPDRIIILGPNHTGYGADTSIMNTGAWSMPQGSVPVDEELSNKLLINGSKILRADVNAHSHEHSIEVQLPFLQYLNKNIRIVPICMRDYSLATCRELGRAIYETIKDIEGALIVASSDMTHYEPQEYAEIQDRKAIKKIIALDPDGLLYLVEKENISMCGAGPVAAMLFAVKLLGAKKSELILYNTSGEASGDYSSVVGYAGIVVEG